MLCFLPSDVPWFRPHTLSGKGPPRHDWFHLEKRWEVLVPERPETDFEGVQEEVGATVVTQLGLLPMDLPPSVPTFE